MQYLYSDEIDPDTYSDRGLCNGIPLRISRFGDAEIKGTLRAQTDWSRTVRPVLGYKGNLGPRFSFMQVTVPECLPERLEVISYANEFAFLYDGTASLNTSTIMAILTSLLDEMERLIDHERDMDGSNEMVDLFGQEDDKASTLKASVGKKANKLQAQIFKEMTDLDPSRAATSMKAWAQFLQLASRSRARPVKTLEEYVPLRVIDAGELIWFGTLTFGMGLTIPPHELDICMELARPGYAALGVTNDLFSWEKERRDAERAKVDYVFNAVWVIMQEQGVSETTAIHICGEEIRRYVSEFDEIVETQISGLSKDTRAYLEAVRHSIVGNLVWSIYCPRYNELE
ncbi:fusicoccadiene synthase [Penicillium sp. IBT 16267x]|nr:fusicoccadiene synthase [Penicillium sp. IBT 16267x]